MCSIFGAVGPKGRVNLDLFSDLQTAAGDRGRDGGRYEIYRLADGEAFLGNWRAIPTPEVVIAPKQPYFGVVHNGTIANDKELGGREGEVDSMVLPRILNLSSLDSFAESVDRIRGSYALAAVTDNTIFVANNYRPIYYWRDPSSGVTYFSSMERHFQLLVPSGSRPAKVPPYTAMDLRTFKTLPVGRSGGNDRRAVVIASAGLDSTVVASALTQQGYDVHLLHFQYGAAAEKQELRCVQTIAERLGASWSVIPLDFRSYLHARSTLLDGRDEAIGGAVEGAEYAIDWVPARNLIMLALATGFAEANEYGYIALGNNLEEAGAYPDNEEEFTHLFDGLLDYAIKDRHAPVRVIAPVGNLMKHEIVALGLKVGAPLDATWSCYRGGAVHCGKCGPCFMRRTAFERLGKADPVFR